MILKLAESDSANTRYGIETYPVFLVFITYCQSDFILTQGHFEGKGIVAERVGFEPTVGRPDTRSPGAPDSPLQHLSEKSFYRVELYSILCFYYFGGEGGIRTHAPQNAETAFRERHHKPLGHLSVPISEAKMTPQNGRHSRPFLKKLTDS